MHATSEIPATPTLRAKDVLAALAADHTIRRATRTGKMMIQHAHVRDEDGQLVARAHESTLRKLERDRAIVRVRRGGQIEWVLR